MNIRDAKPEDLPRVCALLDAVGLPISDLTETLLTNFQVAGEDTVVGTVGFEPYGADALLRSLAVSPAHRAMGLGRELVTAAETTARKRGISTLVLLTTSADTFFQSIGYSVIRRADAPIALHSTGQFAGLCPSSSVCMRKALTS